MYNDLTGKQDIEKFIYVGAYNDILFSCMNTIMPDGFNVKPFNVILEPNVIKSYFRLLEHNIRIDNHYKVYLTSLHSLDGINYDNPMVCNGYYFNGEIGLPMTNSKLILPCGIFAKWEK